MLERTGARGWTPLAVVLSRRLEPRTCLAMAEGAAGREAPAPLDVAGGEDDPRAGADAAFGDAAPAASGGRMRDRRSGVALPGAAGVPADTEAGLLEAARATPRRSSIIKVSGASAAQSLGKGVGWVGDIPPPNPRTGYSLPQASQAGHCFLPPPSTPNLPA